MVLLMMMKNNVKGMLVFKLVSTFKGHCKQTLGTKINIVQGSFRKFEGRQPSPPRLSIKIPWLDEG